MGNNLLVTLISLGVGALLGGVVQALVGRYAAFKESKGMAVALQAEINAIIQIVGYRQYLTHLNQIIQTLQNPAHQPTHQNVFSAKVEQNYFETFNSLSSKIGLLNSLSQDVVLFYTQAKAVLEDFHRLHETYEQALRGQITLNRVGLLNQTQRLHDLVQIALATGQRAAHDLNLHASRRWFCLLN